MGVGWQTPRPGRFTPGERAGTHCIAGWVSPRAGLDGFGKPRPHGDSIPGPSSPYRVAKPTELSRSTFLKHTRYKNKCIIVYDTQCVS